MSKLTDKQRKELYIRYSCAALQGILANPNRGSGRPECEQARDYAIDMITQFENVFYDRDGRMSSPDDENRKG